MTDPGGDQFSPERFKRGQKAEGIILEAIDTLWDPHHIVAVEPDKAHQTDRSNRLLHEIVDYSGIDYVVDRFDHPAFGVNHRTHFNENARRFDIRANTGTGAESELDKLLSAARSALVPRFATRLKFIDESPRWLRVVDLRGFVDTLVDGDLCRDFTWRGDAGTSAALFDYEDLQDRGLVIEEVTFDR
jgi:hypothetical protein